MDKAVLEAMACEKPVLTSNEAFKDMLADNAELLLFAPERPEELAEKIYGLLQMDDLEKGQLGASLRKITERGHSVDHLTDRLVAVFEAYGDR